MNTKFKIGDIVELKSNSPLMTIFKIEQKYDNGKALDDYTCYCTWFKDELKQVAQFSQDTLQIPIEKSKK
jgi:uncharacterized protein YodC (DUF2158 family)